MRPEVDEVDRFRDRTDKARKGKERAGAATATSAQEEARFKRPVRTASEPKPKASSTPILPTLLILALAGACVYLGWLGVQQQSQIEALSADLEDAAGFINQSKLLLARLEGDLSETGAEIAESGTEVGKKLAFLDSEMRKLWGVSNDRNKKAIAENAAKNIGLEETLKKVDASVDKLGARVSQTRDALKKEIGANQQSVSELRSQLSLASGEMSITRDAMEQNLNVLESRVDQQAQWAQAIEQNQKELAAVNASRQQQNERILSLTQQLSALEARVSQLQAPAAGP